MKCAPLKVLCNLLLLCHQYGGSVCRWKSCVTSCCYIAVEFVLSYTPLHCLALRCVHCHMRLDNIPLTTFWRCGADWLVSEFLMCSYFVFICFQKNQLQKQQQQQQQLIPNGKSPERSESPNSTSTATSAGTVTPPSGKIKLQLTVITWNSITEALRIDILRHLYSELILHCVCFLLMKEAMQI
jgi:hypothetical protein